MTTLFFSCGSTKIVTHKNIEGCYHAIVKKYGFTTSYTLVLNNDNTFSFDIKVQDGNPKCKGNWIAMDNDKFLMLECEQSSIFEELTNSYMNKRDHIMQVINKNKLKYKDIILRRKRE